METNLAVFACLFLLAAGVARSEAQIFMKDEPPATILAGTSIPTDQGWDLLQNTGGPFNVVADGGSIRVDTLDSPNQPDDPGASPVLLFIHSLDPAVDAGFRVEFSLQIHRSAYDLYDAGVAFIGDYYNPYGNRDQMVIFGEDRVLWGDGSESYFLNTTNAFHNYRLDVNSAGVQFYVDGTLALQRPDVVTNRFIAFGDESNEGSIDGDFSIQYMTLQIIPEPGTELLAAACIIAGLLFQRRKVRASGRQ